MNKVMVKQLLTSSNYWTLNKSVVKIFGIETAFFLTNLAEAETMMSDKNGWFYQTSETIENMTTLSRYKQDRCIEELEEAGILKKDVRGMPAKRYFKLDYKELSNKIVNNLQTSMQKTNKLDCKKLTTNKERNKEHNYKERISDYVPDSDESVTPTSKSQSKPKKKKSSFKYNESQYEMAENLYLKVKTNFPITKEPNLESWANDIRLMMEQDKRTEEDIKNIIDWSQRDDFWYANIRSTNKLRKQFETLYAQAQRDGGLRSQVKKERDYSSWKTQ